MGKEIKADLPDSVRGGVYADFFSVTVSSDLAIIDFGNTLPEPGSLVPGKNIIVSRVITSRDGILKLADLINEVGRKPQPKDSK